MNVATRRAGAGIVLMTLAAGQFLMTLDSSVMNVSIATVAKDVGTTVTGIQTAITFYTLVMAAFMITGGKVGENSVARLNALRASLAVLAIVALIALFLGGRLPETQPAAEERSPASG